MNRGWEGPAGGNLAAGTPLPWLGKLAWLGLGVSEDSLGQLEKVKSKVVFFKKNPHHKLFLFCFVLFA